MHSGDDYPRANQIMTRPIAIPASPARRRECEGVTVTQVIARRMGRGKRDHRTPSITKANPRALKKSVLSKFMGISVFHCQRFVKYRQRRTENLRQVACSRRRQRITGYD